METLKTLRARAIANRNSENLNGLISELEALKNRASQNALNKKIVKSCISDYEKIMNIAKAMLKANRKLAKTFGFEQSLDLSAFGEYMRFFEL